MIRSLSLILLTALLLAGCSVSSRLQSTFGNRYQYSATMVAPVKSDDMLFRDDRIIIQFRLADPALRFQLQNISPVNLTVDWQNASLGIHGSYAPVRTLASLYDSTLAPLPKQKIPSLGVVRDLVLPRGNVSFDGRQWQRDELLPTTDANSHALRTTILRLVGSWIDVILPMEFAGESRLYHFTLAIDTVRQVAWDSYVSPRWFPPPPPVRGIKPTVDDQITAVILASGFGSFFYHMLTAKKTPVSD